MPAADRPVQEPPPEHLAPMLATLGELPRDPQDWAFEMKWDGVRAIVHVDPGRLRVMSRNDRDVTVSYPELAPLAEAVDGPVILDGEIVSFDAQGRPSFGRLQTRMHVANPTAARRLAASDPAVYLIFDVLYLGGRLVLDQRYDQRRAALQQLGLAGESWQTPPAFDGDGDAAMQASAQAGLEGVVGKRRSSRYLPGRRSPDWVKVKHVRTQEVVLIGWKPGAGRRAGTLGSLLLAIPDGRGLQYVGGVGTGFTEAMLADLLTQLRLTERPMPPAAVPRADARDAHWVAPTLVGEVAFTEWTGDGKLRHPSWRGLRPDKSPTDVRRES